MPSSVFPRSIKWTGGALLVLWVVSFLLSYVPLGGASLITAMIIAVVKAALVVVFFMEIVAESFSVKLAISSAGVLLAILIALMVADLETRETPPLLPFGAPAAMGAAPSVPD